MTRRQVSRCAIIVLLAVSAPAIADPSDPFQSAPVIVASPKLPPRPRAPALAEPTPVPSDSPPVAAKPPNYDGVYVGTMNLTRDAGRCGAPTVHKQLIVQNDRIKFVYNRIFAVVVTGSVSPDGTVNGFGNSAAGGTKLTGRIQGNQFAGVAESASCGYAVQLTKR